MRRPPQKPPLEIGWREWATLPRLCDRRIMAKIDTGAKTSAIHAFKIREFVREGVPHVEFRIHPVRNRRRPEIICVAEIANKRVFKSSNGAAQKRIVIKTAATIGGRTRTIELSLANRDDMGFRLLIGRDALKRDVLINPARSFLLGR
jgi:hypothetical protein